MLRLHEGPPQHCCPLLLEDVSKGVALGALQQPPAGTHTAPCWGEGRLDLHVMSSGCPSHPLTLGPSAWSCTAPAWGL